MAAAAAVPYFDLIAVPNMSAVGENISPVSWRVGPPAS